MELRGSCHCRAVTFTLESRTPYPYMRCYCTVCRKTAGGGGYAINLLAEAASLRVRGRKHVAIYQALIDQGGNHRHRSPGKRHFCSLCGSSLWIHDPRWPQWIYPFASAIDTPLPRPMETQHIMTRYAANWVDIAHTPSDRCFSGYPTESIIEWHRRTRNEVP